MAAAEVAMLGLILVLLARQLGADQASEVPFSASDGARQYDYFDAHEHWSMQPR